MMHLAAKVIAVTGAGTLIGFTSGAFTASVAQANYSSAKGGVYNQPPIARSMEKDQPWTVDERVERLDNEPGQEQMPIFGYLDEMQKAAAAKKAGDASG